MKTPKMIVFDYGGTLLYEPDFDFLRGTQAIFPYIVKNPDHLSPEQINHFADTLYEQFSAARSLGAELHERQFQRLVYEYLGLEFSISYEEAEIIQWNAVSPGAQMPGAGNMIDSINRKGIRSGVISNIGWSGNALKNRLDRLLPNNRFEFVLASSEYGIRKPSPYLFGVALRKAGLPPGEVWYCGNSLKADVAGAAQAGIYPVWYDNDTTQERDASPHPLPPTCNHLHIQEWTELISLLETLTE